MKPDFLTWGTSRGTRGAFLKGPFTSRGRLPQLWRDTPLFEEWPPDARCEIKRGPGYEGFDALSDNMEAGLPVVSERLRHQLSSLRSVEFLPVSVLKDGELVANTYSLLHPLLRLDCIDVVASQVTWNPLDEEQLDSCSALILKAVPPEATVFRAKHLSQVLVRRELVDALAGAGLSGLEFYDAREFTGAAHASGRPYWVSNEP